MSEELEKKWPAESAPSVYTLQPSVKVMQELIGGGGGVEGVHTLLSLSLPPFRSLLIIPALSFSSSLSPALRLPLSF